MERDQASKFVNDLLRLMVSRNGSDLFLTADFPPAIKVDGKVTAKNAHNETVTINIEQAGDNVSKVSIRVGTTGDEAVSKQILDKTKEWADG